MAQKLVNFRLEKPYVELFDALVVILEQDSRADVLRRLLARVKIDPAKTGEEYDIARRALEQIAVLQEVGR